MTKVELLGPRTKAYEIINALHQNKLMHIVDHKKTDDVDIGLPLADAETIAKLLIKIRALLSLTKEEKALFKKEPAFHELQEKIETLSEKYEAVQKKIKEKQTTLTQKEVFLQQLDILNALYLDIELYNPYKSLAVFVGYIKERNNVKGNMEKITKNFRLYVSDYNKKKLIALFVDKKHEEKTANLLVTRYQYQEADISLVKDLNGAPLNHINKLNAEKEVLEKDIEKLKRTAKEHINKNTGFLNKANTYLSKEAEKNEAPLRFAATKQAFIAKGWVPEEKMELLKQELKKVTQNKYDITLREIEKEDKVPIILNNPQFAKPLEFFMHLYTLPKYNEMDPTFFMFLTFPFFFGMMLGDVGYGIITLALFWWLKKKIPEGKMLLTAMMYCSLATIVFGVLFGEYMGYEHVGEGLGSLLANLGLPVERMISHGEVMYDLPRLFNRAHSQITILGNTIPTVLLIGGILGFIHVNIALFLGFLNELKSHGLKHAIFAKLSWYVLQIAVALLALSALKIIAVPMYVGYTLLALTMVMLYVGEGIQGLVELPAIFSNMLSYLRLAAVGLASVGLAIVVNENLVGPFMEKGGLYIIAGILIFIVGHTVNIALGVIGPFLHSLRLHYVEFFSKFYHGGGIQFVPFGKDKK